MSTTATIETAGLRFLTEDGGELDYSSGRNLTWAIEDSEIFSEGQASGAVLVMLSIDGIPDQNRVQIQSPRNDVSNVPDADLGTIERTIELLTVVRDALQTKAATS